MRNESVHVLVELAILVSVALLELCELFCGASIENDEFFLENGEGWRWWGAVVEVKVLGRVLGHIHSKHPSETHSGLYPPMGVPVFHEGACFSQ